MSHLPGNCGVPGCIHCGGAEAVGEAKVKNEDDLFDRLRTEADLCRNETATDIADLLDQAANELKRLRTALADANSLCRSAAAIAQREGASTNWPAFRTQLDASLKRQHSVMYPKGPNG